MKVFFMTLFIFVYCVNSGFAQNHQYSPDQLLKLMEASMQRYETISAEMEAVSYIGLDGTGKPKLQRTRHIISRWTQERSFSETVEKYANLAPGQPEQTVKRVIITPQWHKILDEASDKRTPRGYINQGCSAELAFYTPLAALWDIFCQIPWNKEKLDLNNATVDKDNELGLLIFKCGLGFGPKSPYVQLYIDPNRDFIPVIKEFRGHDGTLFQRYEISLQKSASGLWIPKKYGWNDPRIKYSTKYRIKKIEVNTIIPEALLDFAFPKGTAVVDKMASLQYLVDDDKTSSVMIKQGNDLSSDAKNTDRILDMDDLKVRTVAKPKHEELEKTVGDARSADLDYSASSSSSSYFFIFLIAVLLVAFLIIVYYIYSCKLQ